MIKKGFTLAEVLITLGVIGVVAAITLPPLIQNYKKHVVETRLKTFYSNINQAILLAENEYGDKKSWTWNNTDDFFNTFLKNNLNYLKTDSVNNRVNIYFVNSSACIFYAYNNKIIIFTFFPDSKNFENRIKGKTYFSFLFAPNESNKFHKNLGVEPYKLSWDGNFSKLYSANSLGCNKNNPNNDREYCTAIIQLNGWKIPKEYPFKF